MRGSRSRGDERVGRVIDDASNRLARVQLSLWWTLVGACLLISFTPGAGAISTMANSLAAGWARSLWGVLGQQVALVIHILIVALGVGVLVAANHWLFNAIRWIGAAYLVFLGVRLWLDRPMGAVQLEAEVAQDAAAPASLRPWPMFRRGVLVNLTNPKAIVFFLAFMPQFIQPDAGDLLQQYLIFTATVVVIDIVVMWFFFALAAKGLRRFMRDPKGQRLVSRIFGTLYIAVAGLLLLIA